MSELNFPPEIITRKWEGELKGSGVRDLSQKGENELVLYLVLFTFATYLYLVGDR